MAGTYQTIRLTHARTAKRGGPLEAIHPGDSENYLFYQVNRVTSWMIRLEFSSTPVMR
jgi:hypothetical protein